ncbi:MAG: hypothetical protein OQK00_02060 [Rhodobacteraceae bacterium]|nr:hypothetical protein [Paracoccaceae bacterium]MCW9042583.1 hypothetical protein [Pseudopelagicola sp.]
MWKWIVGFVGVAIVGYAGFSTYTSYRAGFFSLPDLQPGEYAISFNNGLRAIVVDPELSDDASRTSSRFLSYVNPDRKYLGVPYEVPSWFEDAWSYCEKPTGAETNAILNTMPEDMRREFTGARIEGICTIDADGEKIPRGLLFSVPKL